MSDRGSPTPGRGSPHMEPTRDYDIIDDEAVDTTAPGLTSMSLTSGGAAAGLRRKVLGGVGQALNTESIFRKGVAATQSTQEQREGGELDEEMTEVTEGVASSTTPSDGEPTTEQSVLHQQIADDASEGEMQYDKHRPPAGAGHGGELTGKESTGGVALGGSLTQEPHEAFGPTLNLPRVNCPEKIIICIDLATEVNKVPFVSKEGSKHAPLELIKRALNIFVQTKSIINPKHQFALVLLQESAIWIQDFTSDVDDFVNVLFDMTNDTRECESCDLASLFDVIQEKVSLPEIEDIECLPPPHIVRTLFVYGRSRCIPQLSGDVGEHAESRKSLSSSPYFFFDVFYLHEPPTEDNYCKEIYDVFLNLDVHNTSFIHEVGRDTLQLYQKMAMLTAHPLQRAPQMQCEYNIFKDS